jgi:hypothetical protein
LASHEGVRVKHRSSIFHGAFSRFMDPWFEPVLRTRRQEPRHLTSGCRAGGCTTIPHARGSGLGKAGPSLSTACLSQPRSRSTLPGSNEADRASWTRRQAMPCGCFTRPSAWPRPAPRLVWCNARARSEACAPARRSRSAESGRARIARVRGTNGSEPSPVDA